MAVETRRNYTRLLIIIPAIGLSALLLFIITVLLVLTGHATAFDHAVDGWLTDPGQKGIQFLHSVSFFGSSKFVIGCYVALVAGLLVRRENFAATVTALSGIMGWLSVGLLKRALHRTRPPMPLVEPLTNYSLPSGHACSGFLLYSLLAYFLWHSPIPRLAKIILVALLFLFSYFIGLTRIYLQLHHASDIIAGFFLAIFFSCVSIGIMERKKLISK